MAISGGGGGIRTPGAREGSTVFKTAAFNHSATPPAGRVWYNDRWFARADVRRASGLTGRESVNVSLPGSANTGFPVHRVCILLW